MDRSRSRSTCDAIRPAPRSRSPLPGCRAGAWWCRDRTRSTSAHLRRQHWAEGRVRSRRRWNPPPARPAVRRRPREPLGARAPPEPRRRPNARPRRVAARRHSGAAGLEQPRGRLAARRREAAAEVAVAARRPGRPSNACRERGRRSQAAAREAVPWVRDARCPPHHVVAGLHRAAALLWGERPASVGARGARRVIRRVPRDPARRPRRKPGTHRAARR